MRGFPTSTNKPALTTTVESTKVRTRAGDAISCHRRNPAMPKSTSSGRDGEWVLIVSKKGNAPGYIEMASVQGWRKAKVREASNPQAEGKYEAIN